MPSGRGKGRRPLPKVQTGIDGFDEITKGGLPKGRPTLIVGGPGTGKTLFGMHFLINGAIRFKEPGVFISFEEGEQELAQNVASLGFDLNALIKEKLLVVDNVKIESSEIIETGEYDLEGLFVRLGYAIDSIGAKRVVLDTVESIFSTFSDSTILRSELRRLFQYLKDKGVTSIITGESGVGGSLTREGLEEYVSDAVVALDNRVLRNITTRRMRIIKYRGSAHGSNEYPFMIDENGFSVVPITSVGLTAKVSDKRISSGVPGLDAMLSGKGYYMESTILITGKPGTGKTTFAAEFVQAACRSGKSALFFTYEESESQIVRNMLSAGVDLQPFIDGGRLRIIADRPTSQGLEMHLATIYKLTKEFRPGVVVIDPINSLMTIGDETEVRSTMARIVDFLKMNRITTLLTFLKSADRLDSGSLISSMVDSWVLLQSIESNGEENRTIKLVKARGIAHSNQVREFAIGENGIEIIEPYFGSGAVLAGSARRSQEARDREAEISRSEEIGREVRRLENEHRLLQIQLEGLKTELEEKEIEIGKRKKEEQRRIDNRKRNIVEMKKARGNDGRT